MAKRGGRKKGVPNRCTKLLKEAILQAAEDVGQDGSGTGGLIGYLRFVARTEAKAYASLLGRVLPLQISGDRENPIQMIVTGVPRDGDED